MSIWIKPFIVSTILLVLPSANSAEKTTDVNALTKNELDIRSDDLIERVKREATNGTGSSSDTQVDVLADQLLERVRREEGAQSDELPVSKSDPQEKQVTLVSNSIVNTESSASNWLAAQPPENITIQFGASPERAFLESFMEKSQLPEPTVIFEFDRDGRSWHALVHGSFSSTRDARATLAEIPQQTKLYNPWLRRFASIQDNSN